MGGLQIAYVTFDQELRIVSAITRARDYSDNVIVVDLGSTDDTVKLAEETGAIVLQSDLGSPAPDLAKTILNSNQDIEMLLLISLDSEWKLKNLPYLVQQSRLGNDVFIQFKHWTDREMGSELENPSQRSFEDGGILAMFCTNDGLLAVSKCNPTDSPLELDSKLKVRVIEQKTPNVAPKRQSLATASRLGQFFHWVLASKHPLFLFGIPGIVMLYFGFKMTTEIIIKFDSIDSVSLGVALATLTVTIVGLFASMAAIVLYILGKQIDKIQMQYQDW